MELQNLSEDAVLAVLPAEPQLGNELKTVNEMVSTRCDFDMVLDFSRVEIVTSPNIANLLILHNWLRGCGHKLILCNLSLTTKCIFNVVGLSKFFDFADDKFAALAAMQRGKPSNP